ncbi:hypothetical protein B0H14DRAFT_3548763 [Mycena olivaceomarginata]|nr:hypothetical protein B0H14DRAFT_3548763 [Mycena olivaceomarginata]
MYLLDLSSCAMNRDSGLITQFTEDQPSNVVTFCDRLRCKAPIAPGEKRHYITGYNSEEGKFVCDKWNEAGASISESQVQDIRRDVNAGRKKGAPLSVRQVTAIGNIDGSASHPQFMLPPLQSHSGGFMFPPPPSQPHVSVPTTWQYTGFSQQPTLNQPAYPPQMYGYSSAHSQYRANCQLWGSRAYQSVLEDFITVKYKVLREVPGKDKGVLVRNLVEGNPNIKADATPLSLRVSGIKTMEAKIFSALEGFPINWDRIVLREISNSVDLSREPPHVPYFYARCLTSKPRGKDGVPTFKKPTKPFELGLYIDFDQWEGIERYLTQKEIDKEAYSCTSTTPPSKRRAIPTYQSPNRDQLRDALAEGGSSLSLLSGQDIALTISDRVEFFPISYRPLNELIAAVGGGKFQGFTCDLGKAAQGSIVMEKDNYLGIGTFKTAHPAYLTLMHLTSEGLGTKPNEAVAVKRMYVRRAKATSIDPDGWVVARLTPADEYRKILMEANILQWAVSLMTFTFSFIDHFIQKSSHPPPFNIPDIRFVHAAVAIVHEQPSGRTASTKSTICRSYLVEELIDEKLDGFHKFIHNGNAVSALSDSEDKSLHEMADFLSFTQHVQYYKTAGMVYLSDLQGTLERLTDPQIMTSPLLSSIGNGIDLFGDGNVPAAFAAFPAEHACNKFCAWFKLPQPDANNAAA